MDKVLKQRLIGATILIALAVIFVPMLFDDSPDRDPGRDSALELPPPPAGRPDVRRLPLNPEQARETPPSVPESAPDPAPREFESREITLLEPSLSEPDVDPEPAESPSVGAEESRSDETAVVAAETERPEPPPVAPAEPEPTVAEPDAPAYMVQVASFSSADTADRVMEQLGRLGHPGAVDVIVRGDSRLYRVRTGPYAGRAQADRAQAQIAATVSGVSPVVMSAPAGVPTAASSEVVAFAVQVGSFTARGNADRLTEQLQNSGFDAFIHPDESGSRPIWRVRVGRLATRDQAADLRAELLDQAGLEGLIVSHP